MTNRESAFKDELIRLYNKGTERNYTYTVHADEMEQLRQLYIEEFIPSEKLERYEQEEIIKMMMTQMTAVYRLDPPDVGRDAELIALVNNVKYDGQNLYIKFKKQSPVKMKRFEAGMSKKEMAKKTGYTFETIDRCESTACDMSRQPEKMLQRFANALGCEPEDLFWK